MMNVFVACVPSEPGSLPLYEEAVRRAAPIFVPFAHLPHSAVIWRNKIALCASFSIHEAYCPIVRYASHTETRFCTFNGIPLFSHPDPKPDSWSASLLALQESGSLRLEDIGGYYNLLFSDERSVVACNCSTRVEPLYWMQTREAVVIGNRASLVQSVANRSTTPRYDVHALTPLITVGWLCNESTPFEGVRIVDNGMQATVTAGRVEFRAIKPYLFTERPEMSSADLAAAVSRVIERLVEGMRTFSTFTPQVTINLSGGKDSRIMAALAHAADIPYRCVTSGKEGDRDVIVAREVAAILGAEHTSTARAPASQPVPPERVDVFGILNTHVRQGDGMTNCFDPIYPIRIKANVLLTGHGGECHRGGYVRTGVRPPITSDKMALRFLENLSLVGKDRFLRPEAIHVQQRVCREILDRFSSDFPPANFYDYAYTKCREGRGVANLRQAAAYGAFAFSPFLNDAALRVAWTVPLEYRQSERLYHHILSSLHPALASHRFSDSRWKFEADGPLPGADPESWRQRAPLPPTDEVLATHSWRLAYDDYLRGPIREYLLSNRANRVYELVDYAKIERILASPPPTERVVMRGMYGVLTAAYLFSNDWIPTGQPG
jgi:asparagine synthetase B (glutamine-hydrolysing)